MSEKKLSVSELTRLAFIYAEQDREAYLDAWRGVTDADGKKIKEDTASLIKQLRDYRCKRWGRTKLETLLSTAKPVDVLKKKGQQ